ncbi:hypothetical protein HDC93_007245 [Streptomyces sp. AK010]|nr:hypothetical protein [Streptomyces sp. AK010]
MERVNSCLGKHLWLQVLLSVLVAGAVVWMLYPERSPVSVVTRVAVTSLGGVVVLLVVRRKEKRAAGGSADNLVSLDRMLRRGEVPTDPQTRHAMRDLVDHRLHRTRHRVAAQILLAVMWATLVVLMAPTRGPAADPRHDRARRSFPDLARPLRQPAAPPAAHHARGASDA